MTVIGEAFVNVRPDMAGFEGQTRSKLETIFNPSNESGIGGILSKVGLAAIGGLALFTAASVKTGMDMQTSQAQIQGQMDITAAKATKITNAFYGTMGAATFSATAIAKAFGPVAGEFEATEGHVLGAKESMLDMNAAMTLADATTHDLGGTTSDLASIMQAYHLKAKQAGDTSNYLFNMSRLTGVSIDDMAQAAALMHQRLGTLMPSLHDTGALLVDLEEHGTTGSRGLRAATTAITTLMKQADAAPLSVAKNMSGVSNAVTNAQLALQAAQQKLTDKQNENQAALASQGALTVAQSAAEQEATTAVATARTKLTEATAKYGTTLKGSTSLSAEASQVIAGMGLKMYGAKGHFIGMRNLIAELQPKFAQMSDQQQRDTAQSLFGASAWSQMLAIVKGGPAAYDKAAKAVSDHGAVTRAATAYQHTFSGQLEIAKATVTDLAGKFGGLLLPVINRVMHVVGIATNFFIHNKAAAIALGAVVGGLLTVAIGTYLVNATRAASAKFMDAARSMGLFGGKSKSASEQTEQQTSTTQQLADIMQQLLMRVTQLTYRLAPLDEGLKTVGTTSEETSGQLSLFGDDLDTTATTMSDDVPAATESASTGFFGLGAAMDSVPILGLIGGATLLITHWKLVSKWTERLGKDMVHWLTKPFDWVKQNWPLLVGILTGPFGLVVVAFTKYRKETDRILGEIGHTLEHVGDVVRHAFAGAGHWLLDAGKDILKGLVRGIEDGGKWVWHAMEHVAHAMIMKPLHDIMGIFSPSTKMAEDGRNLMMGLAQGISGNHHLARDAMANATRGLGLTIGGGAAASAANSASSAAMAAQMAQIRATTELTMAIRQLEHGVHQQTSATNTNTQQLRRSTSNRSSSGGSAQSTKQYLDLILGITR